MSKTHQEHVESLNNKLAAAARMQELRVLETEVNSLKKGARIYTRQPNSNVFFHADKDKVLANAKKDLDRLIKSYEQAEAPTASGGNAEKQLN